MSVCGSWCCCCLFIAKMKKPSKKKKEKKSETLVGSKKVVSKVSVLRSGKTELDSIFKTITSTKSTAKSEKRVKTGGLNPIISMIRNAKSDDLGFSTVSVGESTRRRTEDNLPIYTLEELDIGKGGSTELCPFDCDCCF